METQVLNKTVRLLILGLLMASSCTTRDPNNPLDPDNPLTGGKPRWLQAVSDSAAVDLFWSVPFFGDVRRVYLVDTRLDSVLWHGPVGGGEFRHQGVPNHVPRGYRLELELLGGTLNQLPEETATPGPEVPWVLDALSEEVVRLSPDGVRGRNSVFSPGIVEMLVDQPSGGVLTVNFFLSNVSLLDSSGNIVWTAPFFRPRKAVRSGDEFWILDPGDSVVVRLNRNGRRGVAVSLTGLATDLAEGLHLGAWVAAEGLVYLDSLGSVTRVPAAGFPQQIAGVRDGGVWTLNSEGTLIRRSSRGDSLAAAQTSGIVRRLKTDPWGNGVWMVLTDALVRLDGQGVETNRIPVSDPRDAAIPTNSLEPIWVADTGSNAVLRITASGEVISSSLGLGFPGGIQVLFGGAGHVQHLHRPGITR